MRRVRADHLKDRMSYRWTVATRTEGNSRRTLAWRLRFAGLVLTVGAGAAGSGCRGGFTPDGDTTLLRVENASQSVFTGLTVLLPGRDTIAVDSLFPGGRTPFRPVAKAYRIATSFGFVDGKPFRLQVIDFVGEEPLGSGRFTYVFGVGGTDTADPFVTFELRRD